MTKTQGPPKLTEQQLRNILHWRQAGRTVNEIAATMGLSRTTITRVLYWQKHESEAPRKVRAAVVVPDFRPLSSELTPDMQGRSYSLFPPRRTA